MLSRNLAIAILLFTISTVSAVAQSTVTTTGGTVGTVPFFNSSTTLGNSAILQSNGNIGIGSTPLAGRLYVFSSFDPTILANYNGEFSSSIDSTKGNAIHYWSAVSNSVTLNLSASKLTEYDAGGSVATNGYQLYGGGNAGSLAIYDARGDSFVTAPSVIDSMAAFRALPPADHSSGMTTITNYYGLYLGNLASSLVANSYGIYQTGGSDKNYFAGSVGFGTSSPGAKVEINGGLRFTGDAPGTVQTTAWTGVLCGGDYAEAVEAAGGKRHYEPGDVLVVSSGNDNDVQKSTEPYSTMVAGIFATKPGVVGRRQSLTRETDDLPMAMVGIVPTKVTAENGPIHKGDLLVTSSVPGYAMKGTDRMRMLGAVVGKAMGKLDSGRGVIEVLVTLQ